MNFFNKIGLKLTNYNSKYILKILQEDECSKEEVSYLINKLPEKSLTEEVIITAIKKGYQLTQDTPNIIKDNPVYILEILQFDSYQSTIRTVLKFVNQDKLTDEIIAIITRNIFISSLRELIDEGFVVTNKNLLKSFIMESISYTLEELFIMAHEEILSEEIILLAIEQELRIDRHTPDVIRKNSKYMKALLEYNQVDCLDYSLKSAINDEIIELAVKKGYSITSSSPEHLRTSLKLVKEIIEHGNTGQITISLGYCDNSLLKHDLIEKAISNGYASKNCVDLIVPPSIKNNYNYVYRIVNENNAYWIIDHCDDILDNELFRLAISKGYVYNFNTPQRFKSDYNFLYSLIESFDDTQKDNFPLNFINCCDENILDDRLISLAISKGYYIEINSPKIIAGNKKYIYKILENVKCEQVLETLRIIDLNLLDSKVIVKVTKKYPKLLSCFFLLHENIDKIELILRDVYIDFVNELDLENRKRIELIKNKFGICVALSCFEHPLFDTRFIDKMGFETAASIFKYGYLANEEFTLAEILHNNELDNLIFAYTIITGKTIDRLDTLLFVKFINFFNKYKDIIMKVIASHKISEYQFKLLRLVDNRFDLDIKTLDDLDKLDNIIYDYNQNIMLDTSSDGEDRLQKLKDTIIIFLTDNTYKEMCAFINNILNSTKAKILQDNIENEDIRGLLDCYIELLNFLEFIIDCDNVDELVQLLRLLNEYYINNLDKFNILVNNFKDIKKVTKYIYGHEANCSLTSVKSLKQGDFVKIEKDKYTSSDVIYGESLRGRYVDYIEIEQGAYLFAHIMNAFGTGGKLSEFKKPRLIGNTFICLSAITNKLACQAHLAPSDINDVTLLFDNIDPNDLVLISNMDINSRAPFNSLNITSKRNAEFNTFKNVLESTINHNEYVVYRESIDGKILYPSAVLVVDDLPNQNDINAALYLGVPLVKIIENVDSKDFDDYEEIKQNRITENLYLNSEEIYALDEAIQDIVPKIKSIRKGS